MKPCAVFGVAGLALLLFTRAGAAQGDPPVQLAWQAPANCPQEGQVRQKLRDLLGASVSDLARSRLRAEGRIEPVGERFRLTLNIHYDLVNGTRVVQASSCEDLSGVAAVTLALLFRAEQSSSAPLTARDLGEASTAAGAEHRSAADSQDRSAADSEGRTTAADSRAPKTAAEKPTQTEQGHASDSGAAHPRSWRFAFRVPELRADMGVLPDPSYGIGLAAGVRHDAWRFLVSGTFWLAQDYQPGPFVGYGAHFGRVSGELSVCRGFRFSGFELAPCALASLDDVSATGTGVGISSTSPRTAWVSLGAGVQGLWSLTRNMALVFGINARIATSRPRFVRESLGENDGEIAQVGPAALGAVLGCEWLL